ncbi:MAG: hypothetical protein AAF730_00310 [Bacteroidota bacterium]
MKRYSLLQSLVAFLVVSLCSLPVLAATGDTPSPDDDDAHHAHHAWHAAFFVGSSTTHGQSYAAFGADVLYQPSFLKQRVSVGLLGDIVLADHLHGLAAANVVFHPFGNFGANVAPGVFFVDGHQYAAIRTGVSYNFAFGNASIAPTLNWDFAHGEVHRNAGFMFGIGL